MEDVNTVTNRPWFTIGIGIGNPGVNCYCHKLRHPYDWNYFLTFFTANLLSEHSGH